MDIYDVRRIVETTTGSDILELKETFDKAAVGAAIAALATHKGAKLLIGVKNDKTLVGIDAAKDLQDTLVSLARSCKPPVYIDIEAVPYEKKTLVIITVPKGPEPPYSFKGIFYKRVGATNQPLTANEITKIKLESTGQSFDNLAAQSTIRKATLQDIDDIKVQKFARIAAEKGRLSAFVENTKQALFNLGILINDQEPSPTNAAIMMFGKDPREFIPYCALKLARIKGTTIANEFLDMQDIVGDIPTIIEQADSFVKRNTKSGAKIVGMERLTITEYPHEAIREAIVNAIAHRDYGLIKSAIQVTIFDDRIEVFNPGSLLFGLTEERIIAGASLRRNPKLADLLFKAGYVENWGTGIPRMRGAMQAHGLAMPKFELTGDWFKVILQGPLGNFLDVVKNPTKRTSLAQFNDRQVKVLHELRDGNSINSSEYAKLFSVSQPQATRDLKELADQGLAVIVGGGPATRYVLS